MAELSRAAQAAADIVAGRPVQPGAMTHAWLFTGPAGSGRSVAARALAAAVQCDRAEELMADRPKPTRAAGSCSSCHSVLAGSHPDVRQIVPEGLSIGVNEMRAVVGMSARRPSLGRWQVVVIEDADRLTEGASNALLKAIEEPPERTIFLLCAPSTHPDDVIVTIRSRCRVVGLRIPPAGAIAAGAASRRHRRRRPPGGRRRPRRGHVGRARRLARDEQARRAARRRCWPSRPS